VAGLIEISANPTGKLWAKIRNLSQLGGFPKARLQGEATLDAILLI